MGKYIFGPTFIFHDPTWEHSFAEVELNVSYSYRRPWLNTDLLQGANPVDIDWVPARFEGRGMC